MRAEADDEFERPALEWLFREAARLAASLRAAGVDEPKVREVCHDYFFGLAHGLDDEPVDVGGEPYQVGVVITTPDERLLLATDLFALHEMAGSIVDEVLDLR